jgi:hypothetical protein
VRTVVSNSRYMTYAVAASCYDFMMPPGARPTVWLVGHVKGVVTSKEVCITNLGRAA